MMRNNKQIVYGKECREKIISGVNKIANTVKITMGPKGRNVVLERAYGAPIVTNDGVTIAREIFLKDSFENMGAQLLKEAAGKTNDAAGDGTTTAAVLTQAIITQGSSLVEREKLNPVMLKKGIEDAVSKIVENLDAMRQQVETNEQMKQVASISCQDEEIGQIIADVYEDIGSNGIVQVEEGQKNGIEVERVDGMQIDSGLVTPLMVTDQERMIANIENSHILIVNQPIEDFNEILPIIQKLLSPENVHKSLVIVADDFSVNTISTLLINKKSGAFNGFCVKSPLFGERRSEVLEDLAIAVGAKVVGGTNGIKIENVKIEDLGFSQRVRIDKEKAIFIEGRYEKLNLAARIAQLKHQSENEKMAYEREKIDMRIARLSGGVAVLKVCASTEVETKDRKYRIEDALNATRSAIGGGVVPGGGSALYRAASEISCSENASKEVITAYMIIKSACESPLRQIVENAGHDIEKICALFESNKNVNFGFDANSPIDVHFELVDMFEAGIIDPAMVTRSALENAASVAAMFLTTEAAIAEEPEEKEEARA